MKKRILAAVAAFAYITAIWWLGGVDFDTRGPSLVFWFLVSGVAGGMAFFAFSFEEKP